MIVRPSNDFAFWGFDLERTIRFARVRCLSRHEIIERVLMLETLDDDEIDAYMYRMGGLSLTPAELDFITTSMIGIAHRTEDAPPEVRHRVDKGLLQLVRLLPKRLASKFAQPFLDHKLKSRRKWAYVALRGEKVSRRNAARLANVFRQTQDKSVLGIVTRTPECVRILGADLLLDLFKGADEEHWRGRVLQCLITYNRDRAIALAHQFPWEFVYAAGRSEDRSLLPAIRSLLDLNSEDVKFVSIYAWCLGKLGALEEIDALEKLIRQRIDSAQKRENESRRDS